MDPKSAAKSKRSQTHQGKRNHPTPSAVAAHKKKEPVPQPNQAHPGRAQSSRRHLRNLPSNWDRYDEDDDDVVEAEEGRSEAVRRDARNLVGKPTRQLGGGGDALVPKSRGADFRYLVDQARSEARERVNAERVLASSPLSDETLPGFAEGLMSVISAKGERLLSWCTGDNFTIDNDSGSSFEVPFLSMDINALAAQLSKLNASRRLFIEEDFLPMEMHAESLDENDVQRFDLVKTQNVSGSKHCLDEDVLPGTENVQVTEGQNKPRESKALVQNDVQGSVQAFWGQESKQNLLSSLESIEQESQRHSRDSGANVGIITVQDSATKFEAAAAEAELNRLLDSFGGINDEFASLALGSSAHATHSTPDHLVHTNVVHSMLESSSIKTGAGVFVGDTVEMLAEYQASSSPGICKNINNKFQSQLKHPELSTDVCSGYSMGFTDSRHTVIEKSVDDLLAETSFFDSSGINVHSNSCGLEPGMCHERSVHVDAPHQMEDHDLGLVASTISLDATIDDLLAETSSYLRNPEPSSHPQGKAQKPSVDPTASKALEDIDTWLDSF